MNRPDIDQYAKLLIETIALRSEDPHTQVGALAMTSDNRIIATAYNGLPAGFAAHPDFWDDANRDFKAAAVIHAEENLCSLFKRGEAHAVYTTHSPCSRCLMTLIAHRVSVIKFIQKYHRDWELTERIADYYGIELLNIN